MKAWRPSPPGTDPRQIEWRQCREILQRTAVGSDGRCMENRQYRVSA